MSQLLDTIVRHVSPPTSNLDAPFQMLVSMIEKDSYLRRILTRRVASGVIRVGDRIHGIREADTGFQKIEEGKICGNLSVVRLQELFKEEGCAAKLRLNDDGKPYVTDNSNYIVDLYFKTPIRDGLAAGKEISAFEGVVEHGLFLDMATAVIIAGKLGVEVKSK